MATAAIPARPAAAFATTWPAAPLYGVTEATPVPLAAPAGEELVTVELA